MLWIGRHPPARKDLGEEEGQAEAADQDGDVPVDGAFGHEAHLTKGSDEQEAAAGRQSRDFQLNGGIACSNGLDRAVGSNAHHLIAFGDAPLRRQIKAGVDALLDGIKAFATLGGQLHLGGLTDPNAIAARQGCHQGHMVLLGEKDRVAGAVERLGFDGGHLIGGQHLEIDVVGHVRER